MNDDLPRKIHKMSELRRGVLILAAAVTSLLALEIYGCQSEPEALIGAERERNFDQKVKTKSGE